MAKLKIKRGLSDQAMMGGWREKATFENGIGEESLDKPTQPIKKESFFSAELQEKVAKYLLEIKLSLFQQGILDYDISVSRQGNQVTLTAVARTAKHSGK